MKLLYGVGVGPGDPELLTLKAARVIREAHYVFAPRPQADETGLAERAAAAHLTGKQVVFLHLPMGPDNAALYRQIAETIVRTIHDGEAGAFLTIGDPSVYSTFTYVMQAVQQFGVKIAIVPGISSFSAAAAVLQVPLVSKQESFYLADGGVNEAALPYVQSVCVLKPQKHKADTLAKLERHGFTYASIKRCSLPQEEILRTAADILQDDDYMTVMLARQGGCAG